MKTFFDARSVAIIGVSENPHSIASPIIKSLKAFGFKGAVYAVGKYPGTVHGESIYLSISDIPEPPELAVVLVKAQDVVETAQACGRKGIKRLVIPTAKFSEFQKENRVIEEQLLDVCKRYGMRIIGPNCYGIANFHNGLFLPFGFQRPIDWRSGPVGVISQSGNNDRLVDATFRQSGIIRVSSVDEMADCVKVLLLPPLKGPNLVSMASTGGVNHSGLPMSSKKDEFSFAALPQSF